MVSHDIGNVWIEIIDEYGEFFVGFVELFSDKMATVLKSTMFVAHDVHTMLLNMLGGRKQCLVGNRYTLVDVLYHCAVVTSSWKEKEA